jgi:hypothetical protein
MTALALLRASAKARQWEEALPRERPVILSVASHVQRAILSRAELRAYCLLLA